MKKKNLLAITITTIALSVLSSCGYAEPAFGTKDDEFVVRQVTLRDDGMAVYSATEFQYINWGDFATWNRPRFTAPAGLFEVGDTVRFDTND